MKKNIISLLLSVVMTLTLTACTAEETIKESPVELNVTTTFAGEDTNAKIFKEAVSAWCEITGNKVADSSATSDEAFKTRVLTDFETGSEPDVLFFFNGADANNFIQAGKVMSLEEIRKEYPEFASNMDEDLIPASLVDGKKYAVPVNGYWEALFVNMEVLNAAGVAKPGADYTWEQFALDCEKIKDAGFVPIAAALGNIPHYWWEFSIFNHTGPEKHLNVPANIDNEQGQAWISGMEDIRELYEAGFFPENTLSATDDETFAMFTEGRAAFLIDGSWKMGGIVGSCQADPNDPATLNEGKLEHFDVVYVPSKSARKATDMIGGLSMGYYITRAAWGDPAKKEAAVSFVEYMSSDDVVSQFAQYTPTALENPPRTDLSELNSLQVKAVEMLSGATSLTQAVQDLFEGDCRASTFDGMPDIVTGKVTAADAVAQGLKTYNAQH